MLIHGTYFLYRMVHVFYNDYLKQQEYNNYYLLQKIHILTILMLLKLQQWQWGGKLLFVY